MMPTLQEVIDNAIEPALRLLPERMSAPTSRERLLVQLLANGLQESRFKFRYQVVQGKPGAKGPARGFWMFEKGTDKTRGGVTGVLLHSATREPAKALCRARGVPATAEVVWQAVEDDDVLAAGFARLLLWTDPFPLPNLGEAQEAWELYLRTWRPGQPHRHTWDGLYAQALDAVK